MCRPCAGPALPGRPGRQLRPTRHVGAGGQTDAGAGPAGSEEEKVLHLAISWAANVKTEAYAFTSDLEADESVTDILRVVGMSKNFRIHAPDYPMRPPAFETVCKLLLHEPGIHGGTSEVLDVTQHQAHRQPVDRKTEVEAT